MTAEKAMKLLNHQVRVAIVLDAAEEGVTGAKAVAKKLTGTALGLVAYHVRTLHEQGVIHPVQQKQVRGAIATYYALTGLGKQLVPLAEGFDAGLRAFEEAQRAS